MFVFTAARFASSASAFTDNQRQGSTLWTRQIIAAVQITPGPFLTDLQNLYKVPGMVYRQGSTGTDLQDLVCQRRACLSTRRRKVGSRRQTDQIVLHGSAHTDHVHGSASSVQG